MEKYLRLLGIIAINIPASYVTTLGFNDIITYFHGKSIGMWSTYFLIFAIAILFSKHEDNKIEERDSQEIIKRAITALIMDCIAVFVILPNVLN